MTTKSRSSLWLVVADMPLVTTPSFSSGGDDETLKIGTHVLRSRLIVGTGKYDTLQLMGGVAEGGQGRLEAALADVAPGADHVGVDGDRQWRSGAALRA